MHWGVDPVRSLPFRFDPTQPGRFGVVYAAPDFEGAFVETLGRDGAMEVTRSQLAAYAIARVEPARPLRLVDLTGTGLKRLGAEAGIATCDYRISCRWSDALYDHPQRPEGLLDRSRHDPSALCVALYDRAASVIAVSHEGTLLDPRWLPRLAALLDRYAMGFSET